MWPDSLDLSNATHRTSAVAEQAKVLTEFHVLYGDTLGDKLGWYQTVEGSLNQISGSAASAGQWLTFHNEAMSAFHKIKPAEQLWSPNWQVKHGEYSASGLAAMEANFETIFCGLDLPLALHFQDFLGQSVSFEFPFFFNYSAAFTCEGDSVPYYKLLKRVAAKCPKLREVKVNMVITQAIPTPCSRKTADRFECACVYRKCSLRDSTTACTERTTVLTSSTLTRMRSRPECSAMPSISKSKSRLVSHAAARLPGMTLSDSVRV